MSIRKHCGKIFVVKKEIFSKESQSFAIGVQMYKSISLFKMIYFTTTIAITFSSCLIPDLFQEHHRFLFLKCIIQPQQILFNKIIKFFNIKIFHTWCTGLQTTEEKSPIRIKNKKMLIRWIFFDFNWLDFSDSLAQDN